MEVKNCDKRGRVELGESLRLKYGERFLIVEAPDGIVLVPVGGSSRLGKALETNTLKGVKVTLKIEGDLVEK